MKANRFVALLIVVLFCFDVMAQALAIGKISMAGDVKVTGPGKTVFTGAEGEAPLFPGSAIKVGDGKAVINIAGKGSIVATKNSSLSFTNEGIAQVSKGEFQIKVLPGKSLKVVTPNGELVFKAPGESPKLFSLAVTEEGTRASGAGIILAGGKVVNPGETYVAGAMAKTGAAVTSKTTLIGLGIAGVAGAGLAAAAIASSNDDHGKSHEASPSRP